MMTWTYNETVPTSKDKVRAMVGDTDSTRQLLQDELIAIFITDASSNIYRAAAIAAQVISAYFTAKASVSIGPMSVSFGEQAQGYSELAERLFELAAQGFGSGPPEPFIGGLSKSERDQHIGELDFIDGEFWKGMHDNPESPIQEKEDISNF